MIKYYLEDSGIFFVDFSDKITFNDIKKYLEEFENIKNLPNNLILLYDMQKADLDFGINDISSILQLADRATIKYSKVKTAFLVDNPSLTVYSMLFSNAKSKGNKQRKVFSTKKAAITWLKS